MNKKLVFPYSKFNSMNALNIELKNLTIDDFYDDLNE